MLYLTFSETMGTVGVPVSMDLLAPKALFAAAPKALLAAAPKALPAALKEGAVKPPPPKFDPELELLPSSIDKLAMLPEQYK